MIPPDLRPIQPDYVATGELLRDARQGLRRESRRATAEGDSIRRSELSELGWLVRKAEEMWRAGQW